MSDSFQGKVIVITGASSGIGRLLSMRCAERGARVVLASRNDRALYELVNEISAQGGEAVAIPVDVSQLSAVGAMVGQALAHYGRIDVLINVAGVSLYGAVPEVPIEEMERVIQTNLLGTIYTTKTVLPIMETQGQGHIINFGSVLSRRAIPLQAAYCASKFGVKGFTDALRLEMMARMPDIHVTLVLPASINTPFFRHARSRMGVRPMPVPPVYQPDVVVNAVLHAIEHPERAVYAGDSGLLFTMLENLFPRLTDRLMVTRKAVEQMQKTPEPASVTEDSFDHARGDSGSVYGEFASLTMPAFITPIWQRIRPWAGWASVAGLGLAVMALRRR